MSGLVIKASAATIYRCQLICCDALVDGLYRLEASGSERVGLSRGRSESLFEYRVPHRVVFVVGSERDGLSEAVERALDRRLSIPMGEGVESLNVAVVAALACYKGSGLLGPGGEASRKITVDGG